jgi:hypothetical protein
MPLDDNLPEHVLDYLLEVSAQADAPPWTAIIEGRDQLGGDSFIQIGLPGGLETDMYVSRDRTPASAADLDVIAVSRTYLPLLVAEIRRLRQLVERGGA